MSISLATKGIICSSRNVSQVVEDISIEVSINTIDITLEIEDINISVEVE